MPKNFWLFRYVIHGDARRRCNEDCSGDAMLAIADIDITGIVISI